MDLTPCLQTLFTAMIPVGELRLSIPLAVYQYGLPWPQALLCSLVGNMIPVPILLWTLGKSGPFLDRLPKPMKNLWRWRIDSLRVKQRERFNRYGALALVILVAIPLPLTGAWTASMAAWIFHVPIRQAILLISLGIILAGIIVTTATVYGGALTIFLAR